MSRFSWRTPAPIVAIGGTEEFLVEREIRNAIRVTYDSGRRVIRVSGDDDVMDGLSSIETFGNPALFLAEDAAKISAETVQYLKENQPKFTGLLVRVVGVFDAKSIPFLDLVPVETRIQHNIPKAKKDLLSVGIRFVKAEAKTLLKSPNALSDKLAEGIVKAVGTDLGVLSFEISKLAACARSNGASEIVIEDARALLRGSGDLDMNPLREALRSRSTTQLSNAMERYRRKVGKSDSVLLVLRGRGSLGELALRWLRAALLREAGIPSEEIGARMEIPDWIMKSEVVPALKRWDSKSLRSLILRLARVDKGAISGDPSPWVSLESALLLSCLS